MVPARVTHSWPWYHIFHLGSKMCPKQFLKGDLSQRGAQPFHFHTQHSCCVHFSNTCGPSVHPCAGWSHSSRSNITWHNGTITVTLVISASTLKNKQFISVRKGHRKSFRVGDAERRIINAAQRHNKTDSVWLNRLLEWLGSYLTARDHCNLLVLQQFLSISQYIRSPTYM